MRRTVTAAVAGVVLAGAVGAGAAWAATGDGPGGRLADVLAGLGTNGTIDQEQADAVEKAAQEVPQVESIESESKNGLSVVTVNRASTLVRTPNALLRMQRYQALLSAIDTTGIAKV